MDDSNNNIIYHNNFINNYLTQVYDSSANNHWYHPDLLEGNYWSDYPGVDDGSGSNKHAIAGDGIGDTNIPWPGLGYDNYPFFLPEIPEMLWIQQFGTDGEDEGWVVSVDSTGVYVAGRTEGILPGQTNAGLHDNFVCKYDNTGNEIWTQQFGTWGSDYILGSAIDSTGLYVTGGLGGDGFVRKYDPYDGSEIWTQLLETLGPMEISVDSSGVYVVGSKPDSYDRGRAISVESTGVYIVGFTEGALPGHTNAGGVDTFVRKYDLDIGSEIWTRQFGTVEIDRPLDVSTDLTGVYVVGYTEGTLSGQNSEGGTDAYIRKYDHSGNEVWTHQFGTSQYDRISEISIYGSDVYVAGQTGGSLPGQTNAGGRDGFVRKYDQCGNEIWTHQFGTVEGDEAYGVAADSTGAYVTGYTSGTLPGQTSAGDHDVFVAKLVSPIPTPTGVGIKIIPLPEVSITFSEVTEAGYTNVNVTTENPGSEMPGFQFLGTYYDITTTAIYTGAMTVSIAYDDTGMTLEEEESLQLLHWNGTAWVDKTINIDTVNNIIYGKVSSLSWFGIAHYSNIPLTIESVTGPLEPTKVGDPFQVTGIFTNPDSLGAHVATFEWDHGEISEVTIDPGVRTVTISHAYTIPGVYSITLTVSNNEGESDAKLFEYVVVYDPEGGFVTGGGWIDSPEGAYPADPELSGKANFGFVAKYKKGATVPTGNTEFQFHVGDLNFHSDTYDWLVIAGEHGMFKGRGSINGEGSYKFILTAVDGGLNDGVDMFRIKIWEENEESGEEIIIYDNSLMEIGGGNIKVHK
jgi:hypothetical protein